MSATKTPTVEPAHLLALLQHRDPTAVLALTHDSRLTICGEDSADRNGYPVAYTAQQLRDCWGEDPSEAELAETADEVNDNITADAAEQW